MEQRRKEATACSYDEDVHCCALQMIGGTAYAVGKRAQRGAEREAIQEARISDLESDQAPPSVPTGGPTDIAAKLTQLKGLLDPGALSQAEFEAANRRC